MVPLEDDGIEHARSWIPAPKPGLLALHHALAYRRPGLWGDDARLPRCVVLVREGDGGLEAFGAGLAEPAVGWLVGLGRAVALLAPEAEWWEAVLARVEAAEIGEVETWGVVPGRAPAVGPSPTRPILVRALGPNDEQAFLGSAPSWALRGWGSYARLVEHGEAFGVPHGTGFAALAWVFDRTRAPAFDAVGVFTAGRFRRLGLGRASASRLIGQIVEQRRGAPLWSCASENTGSHALARALGLGLLATEPLLRWPASGDRVDGMGKMKWVDRAGGERKEPGPMELGGSTE